MKLSSWIKKVINVMFNRTVAVICNISSFWYLKWHGVECKFGAVTLYGYPIISKCPNSRIVIEDGVTLVSSSKHNVAGVNHPVILATLSENAIIYIGKNSGISGSSICAVKSVRIGDGCGLGVNSNIYDTDFHFVDSGKRQMQKGPHEAPSEPVIIGNNVWISANATILKGVTVGDDSVVAMGSVVNRTVGPRQLHGGVPAKKIRDL